MSLITLVRGRGRNPRRILKFPPTPGTSQTPRSSQLNNFSRHAPDRGNVAIVVSSFLIAVMSLLRAAIETTRVPFARNLRPRPSPPRSFARSVIAARSEGCQHPPTRRFAADNIRAQRNFVIYTEGGLLRVRGAANESG